MIFYYFYLSFDPYALYLQSHGETWQRSYLTMRERYWVMLFWLVLIHVLALLLIFMDGLMNYAM